MTRNFAALIVAMVLTVCTSMATVLAAEPVEGPQPRSGDAWLDRQLDDIDQYGARYRESFIDEVVRYHDAPRALVQELVVRNGWTPGDVYYACAMAQLAGEACRNVATERDSDPARGWTAIGKRLGVVPGSPRFGELKRSIVRSYQHWNRPIVLDAQLRKAFPDHEQGKAEKTGDGKRK